MVDERVSGENQRVPGVDERARLFVALELPAAVRSELVGWQERVVAAHQGLRAVPHESLHVTLCFLGWQSASQAGPISEACAVAAGYPAPSLSLGQPIWLPRRRPRVLALELGDPHGALSELQRLLSAQLSAGGWYEAEHRRFLPHVTGARVGRSAQAASGAPRAVSEPPRAGFVGTRVTLYRSWLLSGGARYEALASLALGASAPPA